MFHLLTPHQEPLLKSQTCRTNIEQLHFTWILFSLLAFHKVYMLLISTLYMLLSSPVGTHISNCNHSYRVVSQLVGMVRYEDLGKPKVGYHTKRTEGPARNVKQRGASVTLDVVDQAVFHPKP